MKKNNIDFIVFALKQMKEAQKFGFTANECNRNLKLALNHYWQVMLVTNKEHLKLNSKKLDLTYRMPENWNKKDLFARYKLAKIKF